MNPTKLSQNAGSLAAGALALILIFAACSAKAEEEAPSCACNCWTCVTASGDRLFSLTEEDLLHSTLYLSGGDRRVYLEGEDLDSALRLLNGFRPLRQEEALEEKSEGCCLNLILIDSEREFWITRDSITIGDTRYVGEEDCFRSLLDAFLEGKPVEAPALAESPAESTPSQEKPETPEIFCPCGCEACRCAPSDRLFSYPRDRVISVFARDEQGRQTVLEGDKARACVDALNGFQPQKAEEMPEMVGGGDYSLILLFPDSDRRLSLSRDAVLLGNVLYSGQESCLDGLLDLIGP